MNTEASPVKTSFDFDRALSKVQFEHQLISFRMTWLLQLQLFLLAPYIALSTSSIDIRESLRNIIIFGLVFAGLITSLSIYSGILAAHAAIRQWKIKCSNDEVHALISERAIHFFGELGSVVVGPVIFSIWLLIYLSDHRIEAALSINLYWVTALIVLVPILGWLLYVIINFGNLSKKSNTP